MESQRRKRYTFCVISFYELPSEGIDNFVCVPCSWIILRNATNKVLVSYPQNEESYKTRERVKRNDTYSDEWVQYCAESKYETDTFEDAENWIAMINNYLPLVQESLSINGMQSTSTVDKQSRSGNEKHSLTSKKVKSEPKKEPYEVPRKQLPRGTIKRPASDTPKQQLAIKRMKPLSVSASETKCGVVQNTNAEPSCSRTEEPNITKDCQLIKSTQTEQTTAATYGKKCSEQNNHYHDDDEESNKLVIDTDRPVEVFSKNGDDSQQNEQPSESNYTVMSMSALRPPIIVDQTLQPDHQNNHTYYQDSQNSSSKFQPKIIDVRSMAISANIGYISNSEPSTSQHIPSSLPYLARLYNQMNGKPFLTSVHPPIEKKIRTIKISNDLQNPSNLTDQTKSSKPSAKGPPVTGVESQRPRQVISSQEIQHVARITIERCDNSTAIDPKLGLQSIDNIASAAQNIPSLPQNHFIYRLDGPPNVPAPEEDMQQYKQAKILPRKSSRAQSNNQKSNVTQHQPHGPDSPSINIGIPSFNRYPSSVPNRFIGGMEHPYPVQLTNQLLNQRASLRPTLVPTRPIGFPIAPRSDRPGPPRGEIFMRQPSPTLSQVPELSCNNYLSSDQRLQNLPSQGSEVFMNHSHAMGRVHQADPCMEEEPPIMCNTVTSDFKSDSDYQVISDYKMAVDEEPTETVNNIKRTVKNTTDIPDRSMPTNSSRFFLEQQILDHFSSIFTQLGSILHQTAEMYNQIRSSIVDVTKTYRTLLCTVEKFNTSENPVSDASSSRYVGLNVPPVVKERPVAVAEKENHSRGGQLSNNAGNEAPDEIRNSRFVLPSGYDPNDTRWTLKYRKHELGLVELLHGSGIYVNYERLVCSLRISNNCQSLAQQLLLQVFSREALSVCSSMTEKAQVGYKMRPDARPDLDDQGCLVLLNFVFSQGFIHGWNTDLVPVLQTLHNEVKVQRLRFGVIAKHN